MYLPVDIMWSKISARKTRLFIQESCFYDLAIDYQFTFNLSKPEDKVFVFANCVVVFSTR